MSVPDADKKEPCLYCRGKGTAKFPDPGYPGVLINSECKFCLYGVSTRNMNLHISGMLSRGDAWPLSMPRSEQEAHWDALGIPVLTESAEYLTMPDTLPEAGEPGPFDMLPEAPDAPESDDLGEVAKNHQSPDHRGSEIDSEAAKLLTRGVAEPL